MWSEASAIEAHEPRLQATSPRSIESAYHAYYPALVRRLTVIVGDPHEAEDLAQTTFERALGALQR